MGIDIYMRWKGQTEDERKAQFTGFSVEHGHVGYLREAYFRKGPSVTHFLVPEAFDEHEEEDGERGAPIPAHVLRERLPEAIRLSDERETANYGRTDPDVNKSYEAFVELAERKEKETGEPVRIVASY
jgi:hypothetical protein